MSAGNPFAEDAEDTQTAIMRATFDALVEYGYAGLTIDRIDEFFPKSKSLLYHHYDGKDELLLDFLSRMIDNREGSIDHETSGGARERLDRWLDAAVTPELADEELGFIRALVELRAQAAHDERYREQFTRSDRLFRGWLADIIAEGIDEGVFRDVDSQQVAATIHVLTGGVMAERVTNDDPHVEDVRAELDAYVEARLLAE